jgi:hypothetical protein
MTAPRKSRLDRAHPDYSRAVLEDLYRYRPKSRTIAWGLWILTGFMGGHRFYLDRTGTGILMLLTAGGGLIWWIVDAFLLSGMVDAYNREQEQRERAGLPPIALDFMPALREANALDHRPEWANRRAGRWRLLGDAVVLLVAGTALGAVSAQQGNFEAMTAILALIAITNVGARWEELGRLPLLNELDRWSHRLRLFYHSNDPGSPLSLLVRPIVGPLTAFFSKRARGEVRLYLQLGAVFVILFTLFDLGQAAAAARSGIGIAADVVIQDMVLTFINVYAFATPIGATLTTHLLLERTDRVLWILSAVSVGAIGLGLFSG